MGGRLNIGYVQLTFVLKGDMSGEKADDFKQEVELLLERDDALIDVFMDDYGNKDVEV